MKSETISKIVKASDASAGELALVHFWGEDSNVFFETFYPGDVKYNNVALQILNSEISDSNHTEIAKHFADLPQENRIVCELGLGMNPNVTDLCGYAVLDEKTAGAFHIAVSANNMFGGANKASDHIDFVGCGKIGGIL